MNKDLCFITEYQQWVDSKTSQDYDTRDHALLGMMSELGEIADAIKKEEVYGKTPEGDDGGLFEEIGDLMFYVCMACTSQGILLRDALEHNIEKLNRRYSKGFTKEEAALRRDKK